MEPTKIINVIVLESGLSIEELYKNTYARDIIFWKQILRYLLNKHSPLSKASIARLTYCSPKAIREGCKTVQDRFDTDRHYRHKIQLIEANIIDIDIRLFCQEVIASESSLELKTKALKLIETL